MAAEARAADLPEGSIVAAGSRIYYRGPDQDDDFLWRNAPVDGESTNYYEDRYVDHEIADGAQVLRHGYGEEKP